MPIYWLLTFAKVLLIRLHPSASLNGLGSKWHILASFFFLPSYSNTHALEPVLIVGWTLNLEMFFYLVFACALGLRISPVRVVVPVLGLIALLSLPPISSVDFNTSSVNFYRNPIILEFAFGALLAALLPRARRLPLPAALIAFALGVSCLLLWAWPRTSQWRFLGWGMPGLAIVWAAVALEKPWGRYAPAWLLELGDSSYSLYLVHGFTLPLLSGALIFWIAQRPAGQVLVFLVLILLSLVSGELFYRALELPITRWFRGRRPVAVPVNA